MSGAAVQPGRLDLRLTLRSPVVTRDTDGGAVENFIAAGYAWAERQQHAGGRLFAADAKHYESTETFRVRYNVDIEIGWRVLHGSKTYEVTSVSEVGRKDFMDLECRTTENAEDSNVVNFSAYHASTNSTGNTTITLARVTLQHTESTTLSGAGSTTRVIILAIPTGLVTGARLTHRLIMPATSGIIIEWRNATSVGTLVTSYESDGSGDDVVAEFVYNGTAWNFVRFNAPANA